MESVCVCVPANLMLLLSCALVNSLCLFSADKAPFLQMTQIRISQPSSDLKFD